MKPLSRPKQWFLYIAPFPALAFFKIWGAAGRDVGSLLTATCLLFLYCALVVFIAYRWDKPTYFDWTIAGYFGLALIGLALFPGTTGTVLSNYSVTIVYSCLFIAAFVPPLIGMDPFTYHYAKKMAPKAVWENPIFIRINIIMTYVWAGIFVVCIILSLYPSVVTRAYIPLALILFIGMPFNMRYPDFHLKRLGLPTISEQKTLFTDEKMTAAQTAAPPAVLPTTAWEAVSRLPNVFNARTAGNLNALIGFYVSGKETFEAFIHIEDGVCTLEDAPSREPDLRITTPSDVWLAVSRQEKDGQTAFFNKEYTPTGNLGILIRFNELFSGRPDANMPD